MPENTIVNSTKLDNSEAVTLAKKYMEDISDEAILGAYDISLSSDGEKFTPKKYESYVKINISNLNLDLSKNVSFLHIIDNKNYEIIPVNRINKNEIEFKATSFSVYILIQVNSFNVNFESSENSFEVFDLNGNEITTGSGAIESQDFKFVVRPKDGYVITNVTSSNSSVTKSGTSLGYTCSIGNVTANASVTVTTAAAPVITSHPVSIKISKDGQASFKVTASNASTYLWQYRENSDAMWIDSTSSIGTGNTSNTFTINADYILNGIQVRCLVGNANLLAKQGIASDVANLYVVEDNISVSDEIRFVAPIVITEQPVTKKVNSNETAVYKVVATGSNLNFRWQYRETPDNIWVESTQSIGTVSTSQTAADTYQSTFTVYANYEVNGIQIRCLVEDEYRKAANGIQSDVALMLVGTDLVSAEVGFLAMDITTQPESQKVSIGDTATFTVETAGGGNTYQWQYRAGASGEFVAVDDSIGRGYTTSELQVDTSKMTINEETLAVSNDMNGYQFRCVVTNSELPEIVEESDVALLAVGHEISESVELAKNYSVDGVFYPTLAAAYSAIKANGNEGTITVVAENGVTDASVFNVEKGMNITLDTNGKTINKTVYAITNSGVLIIAGSGTITTDIADNFVTNGETLEIKDSVNLTLTDEGNYNTIYNLKTLIINTTGTISGTYRAIYTEGNTTINSGNIISGGDVGARVTGTGNVVVNGGNISSSYYGIYSDSTAANAVKMTGGTIDAGVVGIAVEANSQCDVTGGKIIVNADDKAAACGIRFVSSSTLNVSGNTNIEVTNKGSSKGRGISVYTGTANITGGTINAKTYGVLNNTSAIVNISGTTTVNSDLAALMMASTTTSAATINVTGGTFNGAEYGIWNNGAGKFVIGNNDGNISKTSPVITSDKYGYYCDSANATLEFNDGILKGKEAAISNAGTMTTPEGYGPFRSMEGDYQTAVLEQGWDISAEGERNNVWAYLLDDPDDEEMYILNLQGTGRTKDYGNKDAKPWDGYESKISKLVIEKGVTGVGDRIFKDLNKITTVEFPSTLEYLGQYAFMNCTSMTGTIILPKSLTDIENDNNPFLDAPIEKVVVEEGNTAYKAVDGVLYSLDGKSLITYPIGSNKTTYTILDKTVRIHNYAFCNAKLTSIIIPESVEIIFYAAFNGSKLAEIVLPSAVRYMDGNTFEGCTLLEKVYLKSTNLVFANSSQFKNLAQNSVIYTTSYDVAKNFVADANYTSSKTTVLFPPEITIQPENVTTYINEQATYTVGVQDGNMYVTNYQWQYRTGADEDWTNIDGANTLSYTIAAANKTMNGYQYRCVLSNDAYPNDVMTFAELESTLVSDAAILYVNGEQNYSVDGNYYSTLAQAYAAIKGAGGTIIVEADNADNERVNIAQEDNIVIDLNGKTITVNGLEGGEFIYNNGTLELKDSVGNGKIDMSFMNGSDSISIVYNFGTLTVTSGTYLVESNIYWPAVIRNYGTTNVNGGILECINNGTGWTAAIGAFSGTLNVTDGTINVKSYSHSGTTASNGGATYAIISTQVGSSKINMSGGTINSEGIGIAIEDHAGGAEISESSINISGSAVINANIGIVNRVSIGGVTITGGTIYGLTGEAVYNGRGTLKIGTSDGTVNTTTPIIQGATCAVSSKSDIEFYDGILKGGTAAYNVEPKIPTGYGILKGTETSGEVEYETAVLRPYLMERDIEYGTYDGTTLENYQSNNGSELYSFYALGAKGNIKYTADKITKIKFFNKVANAPATYEDSWSVSKAKDGSIMAYAVETSSGSEQYELHIVSDGVIFAPENSSNLFRHYINCTEISGFANFDTSKVTNMASMFGALENLTNLDISTFNTSNVTRTEWMFSNDTALETLKISKNFITNKATNVEGMFSHCSKLSSLDVSGWDTSGLTTLRHTFSNCKSIKTLDLTSFNTSKVGNMGAMLQNCSSLETLLMDESFDTSSATNIGYMFNGCSKLTQIDLSNFDTSSATSMAWMFSYCDNLTSLDLSGFDTSKVQNMASMFEGSYNLTHLDLSSFSTNALTDSSSMFKNCKGLTSILLGANFAKLNGTNMLYGCKNLEAIIAQSSLPMALSEDTGLATLETLPTLYVQTSVIESAYEDAEYYAEVFDNGSNVKPILELVGDKNIRVTTEETYTEQGAKVAGFTVDKEANYTQYGYTLAGPVFLKDDTEIDNISDAGTYEVVYSLTYKGGSIIPTVTESRNVSIKGVITPVVSIEDIAYGSELPLPTVEGNLGSGEVIYYYNTTNSTENGKLWNTLTSASDLPVGTYYIYAVISETDNYGGAISEPIAFEVTKGNINTENVSIGGDVIYGETLVVDISDLMYEDFDYEFTWYSNATNSTTGGNLIYTSTENYYTIGKGLVGQYIYVELKITHESYNDATISLITSSPVEAKDMNSTEIKIVLDPDYEQTQRVIIVTDRGEELVEETDYELTYNLNDETDMTAITATGLINYKNTKTVVFEGINQIIRDIIIKNYDMSGDVTITGTNKIGETLTVTNTINPEEAELKYQWYVSDDGSYTTAEEIIANAEKISGETSSKYKVGEGLADAYIYVVVTATAEKYNTTNFVDVTDSINGSATAQRIKVAEVTLGNESNFEYNGEEREVVLNNFDGNLMKAEGGTKATNYGSYTVTISLLDATTYEWENGLTEPIKLTWSISKKQVKIYAGDFTKEYDGTPLTHASTTPYAEGLIEIHNISVITSGSITDVGTTENVIENYTISGTNGDVTGNYDVTPINGTLEVTAKDLSASDIEITLTPESDTYDGTAKTPAVSGRNTKTDVTLTSGDDFTVKHENNVEAGKATVTLTGKGNYKGTKTVEFTINARPITITSADASKQYDGEALIKNEYEITGTLASGDTETVTITGSQTEEGSSANTISSVVIKNASGDDVTKNYEITEVEGTLLVTVVENYSVDGVYYHTLVDAYAAIKAKGNEGTIKVEADNIDDSDFEVEEGMTITIDTTDKTITKTSTSLVNYGTLTVIGNGTVEVTNNHVVHNYSTFTLEDAKLKTTLNAATGIVSGIYNYQSTSKIVMNSGIIEVNSTEASTNHKYGILDFGGTVEVNGGTINMNLEGKCNNYTAGIAMYDGAGTLDISNASINVNGNCSSNINGIYINDNCQATIKEGTIITMTNDGDGLARGITNYGTVNMEGGKIEKAHSGIINNGSGIVNISGNTEIIANTGLVSASETSSDAVITMTGGKITSKHYGINADGLGKIVIGDNSDVVNKTTPIIQGDIYGYYTSGKNATLEFNDGIFKGKNAAINNVGTIKTPDGYGVLHGVEANGEEVYKTAVLEKGWDISGPADTDNVWAFLLDDPENEGKYILNVQGSGAIRDYNAYVSVPWANNGIAERPDYREKISKLIIEEGITGIGQATFNSLPYIKEIKLPSTLKSLGNYAFYANTGVVGSVTIPAGVTLIGINPFMYVPVNEIIVETGNTVYKASNGVLYTEDERELIVYPMGKMHESYIILEGTKEISQYAFYYTNLKSVILPEGLEKIDYAGFANSNLVELIIPTSVNEIGGMAFNSSLLLEKVYVESVELVVNDRAFTGLAPNSIIYTTSKDIADKFIADVNYTSANTSVYYPPMVTTNPEDKVVNTAEQATFTVVVTDGNPTNTTYMWQYRTSATGEWTNVTDAEGTINEDGSFTTVAVTRDMVGYQYRAVIASSAYPNEVMTLEELASSLVSNAGTLTVGAKSLTAAGITAGLSSTSEEYTGSKIMPEVIIRDGETPLVSGEDFTAVYTDNENVGKATVTITGKGNYTGTIERNFMITARAITVKAGSDTKKYDGAPLTNTTYEVTVGEVVSNHNVEVSITGSQTDVGESPNTLNSVTITDENGVDVTGNYAITMLNGTLTVTAADSVDFDITLDKSSVEYNGTAQKPGVTVFVDDLPLTEGTHYEAIYKDNENVGKASVTIKGINNYDASSETVEFTITPRPITITAASETKPYDGKPLTNSSASVTVGSLVNDHTLSVTTAGSITYIGSVENVITSYTIAGASGDMTYNYDVTTEPGTLTITGEINYTVDGVGYPTLEAAYNAIKANGTEGTIIVIKDNTDASEFVVEEGMNIIIDTSDKTITKTVSGLTNNGTLTIGGAGTITTTLANNLITNNGIMEIKDTAKLIHIGTGSYHAINNAKTLTINTTGTISSTYRAILTTGSTTINSGNITSEGDIGVRITGAGNVVVNGGKISAQSYGIYSDSTAKNAITINGGMISSTDTGIHVIEKTQVDITGGTIKVDASSSANANAVFLTDGSLSISGYAEIIAMNNIGEARGIHVVTGEVNMTGGSIEAKTHGIINGQFGKINVSGNAEISGIIGISNASTTTSDALVTVTGGTITGTEYGICNYGAGKFILGNNDGTVSNTTPVIQGGIYGYYGANENSILEFNDGIFKGKTSAINNVGTINTPDGYGVFRSTEGEYETAVLEKGWDISKTAGKDNVWAFLLDHPDFEGKYILHIKGTGSMKNFNTYTDMPWYENRYDIRQLIIEEGVTTVGDRAFFEMGNISEIKLPSTLEYLGMFAFNNCWSLRSVTISAGVTEMGGNPFIDSAITEVVVESGNANYKAVDGVLLTKDGRRLITYPIGKTQTTYEVPSGVEVIDMYAFARANLTSVTLPDTLTSINEGGFNSAKLTSVVIPASVNAIEATAFYNNTTLEEVYLKSKELTLINYLTNKQFVNMAPDSIIYTTSKAIADKFVADVNYTAANTSIYYPPVITSHPESQSVLGGEEAAFSVIADNGNPTGIYYQWQYRSSSLDEWTNVTEDIAEGGTTANLITVATTDEMNGYQFRCLISGDAYPNDKMPYEELGDSMASDIVTLTVEKLGVMDGTIVVTGTPRVGEVLVANTINIVPAGCSYTYEWYVNETNTTEGGETISGATARRFIVTEDYVGKYIYVIVTATKENYEPQVYTDVTNVAIIKAGEEVVDSGDRDVIVEYININSGDIEISIPDEERIYNGAAHRPEVSVIEKGTPLVQDKDYQVTYENNVNAGTAKITVQGIGDYTGTKELTFEIKKREITIKPVDVEEVYDGTPISSKTVEFVEGELPEGHVLEATISGERTDVGTSSSEILEVTIKDSSSIDVTENYDISKENGKLTVTPMKITFNVTLTGYEFTYNGVEQEPGVNVSAVDTILVEGTDYTLEYKDNKNVGEATVTVTGIRNYEGSSGTVKFNIIKRKLEITVGSASKVYDGEPLTLNEYKTIEGQLAENHTLNIVIEGSITNVGRVSNKITSYTIVGLDGDVTSNYDVDIIDGILEVTPATMDGRVVITGTNRFGETLTANVTVEPNESELTYSWYYNSTNDMVNGTLIPDATGNTYKIGRGLVGKYIYVVVSAKLDNYYDDKFTDITDESNGSATVVKADINPTVNMDDYVYNETVSTPSVNGNIDNGSETYYYNTVDSNSNGIDWSVVTSSTTLDAGIYYMYAVVGETADYNGATTPTTQFEVKSAVIDFEVNLDNDEFVYDGTKIKPAVTIVVKGTTLIEGKDYEVEYEGNINVGTGTVTVDGIKNYLGSKGSKEFKINVRPIEITAESDEKVYDRTPLVKNDYEITSGTVADNQTIEVEITGSITDVGIVENVVGEVVIKDAEGNDVSDNYDIAKVNGQLKVTPKADADFEVILDKESYEYTGTEIKPTVVVKDEGITLDLDTEYGIKYSNNVNVGTATITITGKGNYEGSHKTVNFTITKRYIEITAKSASKDFDGTPLTANEYELTSGELAPGHKLIVRISGSITNVGVTSNKIMECIVMNASDENVTENYIVNLIDGTLEIRPAIITGNVEIRGTNRYGQTLTAFVSVSPTDSNLKYTWYSSDNATGTNGLTVLDETTNTLEITGELIGKYIIVVVNATKENYESDEFSDVTDSLNNGSEIVLKADPQFNLDVSGKVTIIEGNTIEVGYTKNSEGNVTAITGDDSIVVVAKDGDKFILRGEGVGTTQVIFTLGEADTYSEKIIILDVEVIDANYAISKGTTTYYHKLEEAVKDGGTIEVLQDVDDTSTDVVIDKNITLDLSGYEINIDAPITIEENGSMVINGANGSAIISTHESAIINSRGALILGSNMGEINYYPRIEGSEYAISGNFTFNGGILAGNNNPPYTNGTITLEREYVEIITELNGAKYESKIVVEKTAPVINVEQDITEVTNKDVTLTITVIDYVSGPKSLSYVLDGKTYELALTGDYEAKLVVSENGIYKFIAEDNAGNISTLDYEVDNIDKLAGNVVNINVEGVANDGIVTNTTVILNNIKVDMNDVEKVFFSNTNSRPSISSADWVTYINDMRYPWILDIGSGNGAKTIYAWALDGTGNISEKPYELKLTLKTKLIGGLNNKVTLSVAGIDRNFRSTSLMVSNLKITADGANVTFRDISLNREARDYVQGVLNGKKFNITLTNVRGTGRINVNIAANTLLDRAGNINDETNIETDFYIDTTTPVVSITGGTLTITDAENNLIAVTINDKLVDGTNGYYGMVTTGDVIKAYDKAGNITEYEVK